MPSTVLEPPVGDARLGQDAGGLPPVDEDVVGPLAGGGRLAEVATRLHHRRAGEQREQTPGPQVELGTQDHGEQRPPRLVRPGPAEPAAAAGLVTRRHERPLGRARQRELEGRGLRGAGNLVIPRGGLQAPRVRALDAANLRRASDV